MARYFQSCSWCDELNEMRVAGGDAGDPSPIFCSNCGHRADLARMQCDCSACRILHHVATLYSFQAGTAGVKQTIH